MKFLFVHQNFPGQYLHLARHLGATPGNEVVFITQRKDGVTLPGVKNIVYQPQRPVTQEVHHYLRDTEAGVLNAQAVARVRLALKESGFVPDVMLGHNGWGEIWYLKDVFPQYAADRLFRILLSLPGADVGFDPNRSSRSSIPRRAYAPRTWATCWRSMRWTWARRRRSGRSRSTPSFITRRSMWCMKGSTLALSLPMRGAPAAARQQVELTRDDEVLTYVARNLEPYRGFPQFMRSLPAILKRTPERTRGDRGWRRDQLRASPACRARRTSS